MSRRRPVTLVGSALPLLLVIGLVGLGPAPAAASSGSAAAPADDQRALALLRRAVEAAASLAYSGTQVVSAWPAGGAGASTHLLEIRQLGDGRRDVTAGDRQAGDEATTTHTTVLGGLTSRALQALISAYDLQVAGRDEVAGRPAEIVVAARGGRVAARLWIDTATGLLLREDVLDADGGLHRMAAFLDVRPAPAQLPPPSPAPGPGGVGTLTTNAGLTRTVRTTSTRQAWRPIALEAARHWCPAETCPDALPGGFTLLDVRRGDAEGAPVLHLLYGDGLSAISVFLQPGRLDREALAGLTEQRRGGNEVWTGTGWPDRLTWEGDQRVFTVISDAVPITLDGALAPLPHDRDEPAGDAFASLRRGLQSVLGWLPGD